jgi:hypothetical protein
MLRKRSREGVWGFFFVEETLLSGTVNKNVRGGSIFIGNVNRCDCTNRYERPKQ